MNTWLAAALAMGALVALATAFLHREPRLTRLGALAVVVALALLPAGLTAGAASAALEGSSSTRFCLSCHEMERYGRSLLVDDEELVPAMHFQNRRVLRERACYACHADYGLFGDLKAKWSGIGHVWSHYVAGVPDKIALKAPYPNANCLGCHRDSRGYLGDKAHRMDDVSIEGLEAGEPSCLTRGCHDASHVVNELDGAEYWRTELPR